MYAAFTAGPASITAGLAFITAHQLLYPHTSFYNCAVTFIGLRLQYS